MADLVALSSLGVDALREGIQFLFGQATEVLRRRRDRQDAAEERSESVELETIGELRRTAGDYVDGVLAVEHGDERLLQTIAELRAALERVLGEPIVLPGERLTNDITHVQVTGERAVGVGRNAGVISTGDDATLG